MNKFESITSSHNSSSTMPLDLASIDPTLSHMTMDRQLKSDQHFMSTRDAMTLENVLRKPKHHSLDKILGKSKPEIKMDMDTLLGKVTRVLEQNETDYNIPEPTPIGPHSIDVVDKVPLTAASWHNDMSYFASMYNLLRDPESNPSTKSCSDFEVQSSSLNFRYRNQANSDMLRSKEHRKVPESIDQKHHVERWNERYQELVDFQRKYKHCLVPLNWPANPSLGHWVKRQRYQHSLKSSGTHSTMTQEREAILEKLGFVWDSHAALWEERWNELRAFRDRHGHCHVPSRYSENPKLSIWVKGQRRQYKLLEAGQKSNMTQKRINKLRSLGFVFNPRLEKKKIGWGKQ